MSTDDAGFRLFAQLIREADAADATNADLLNVGLNLVKLVYVSGAVELDDLLMYILVSCEQAAKDVSNATTTH